MIEFLQITNDPDFARRCDALNGMRLFVDLERLGKAERQAGRNTFISEHQIEDVSRIKTVLRRSRLMVRINPPNPGSRVEVEAVLAQGADLLMLPMFRSKAQLHEFSAIVGGRVPIVALLETAEALTSIQDWIDTPGLAEVFVGLNDLHLSLGCSFMFEPLIQGHVDRVAEICMRASKNFGFGGIARLGEGRVPGRIVLAEHLRLGSQAVILSRTFNQPGQQLSFEAAVSELRRAESELALRDAAAIAADRRLIENLVARQLVPKA
ncbi:MAG: aldolase/citrate lyase family protein [Polaromonas sp.]|uniref:aldolase/citrate lyase family protein n=1 Tax=Polaromonas sp. TaxID=1869339 RepID=UPI0032643361